MVWPRSLRTVTRALAARGDDEEGEVQRAVPTASATSARAAALGLGHRYVPPSGGTSSRTATRNLNDRPRETRPSHDRHGPRARQLQRRAAVARRPERHALAAGRPGPAGRRSPTSSPGSPGPAGSRPGARVVRTTRLLGAALGGWYLGARRRDPARSTAVLSRRLRLAAERLGPTYIKLGQIISLRARASSPRSWSSEFKRCRDQVPPEPFAVVRRVVEEDLGRPLEEVFSRFHPEPLAAASIAQVHARHAAHRRGRRGEGAAPVGRRSSCTRTSG